jgi:predicted NAD-dependent protein-ADP-ribosyltransferase YbiA (DUF1768 family)
MTLLDYALRLVDEQLAELEAIEARLRTLVRLVSTPEQATEVGRLAATYHEKWDRLQQQKVSLLDEVLRYHAAGIDVSTLVH